MLKPMLAILTTALVFLGCDDTKTPMSNIKAAVIHASPDAPLVNVKVNGDTELADVDYAQAGALSIPSAGSYEIAVDAILPDTTTTTVIGPVTLDLMEDMRYTILAVNKVATGDLEPLVISAPIQTLDANQARVQIVHANVDAPSVDVYVAAVGAGISPDAKIGTVSFKDTLGPLIVPSGNYEIYITPEGSSTVVYDSNAVNVNGDLVIAAIPNVGNGTSPVDLLIYDGETTALVNDANSPTAVRVIHNSVDAPAVDIVANDNFASPLIEDLAFKSATKFLELPADSYNIKVAVANTTTDVIDANLTLMADEKYSVYAVNKVASIEPLVIADTVRAVATEAKVRLVHGSSDAGNVDIYVTTPNADITSLSPTFSSVPFKADTGYVSLAPGSYQVRIVPEGTKNVVIDTNTIDLDGNSIYTAIARDDASTTFGLILLDDFVASK